MAFLTKIRSFASKAESVPGTAETLASADNDVRIWDFGLSLDVPMDESPSKYLTGTFGLGESITGPETAKFTFTTKFVNKTGGDEPNWFKYIKAAGCHVSGYDSTYGSGYIAFPTPLAIGSGITFGIYDKQGGIQTSGWQYVGKGAVGNCTISTEGSAKPYKCAWEFSSAVSTVGQIAVGSIPVPTSMDTEIPDTFASGYMTFSGTGGTVSGCVSTMTFNFGNTITPIECQSSDTGYDSFTITDMVPSLEVNPLLNLNYNFWNKFRSGTIEQVVISTRMFVLVIPRAQITAAAPTDANDLQRIGLTFTPLMPTSAHSIAGTASWYIVLKNT